MHCLRCPDADAPNHETRRRSLSQPHGQGDDRLVQVNRNELPLFADIWPLTFFEVTFPAKSKYSVPSVPSQSNALDEALNFGLFSEPVGSHEQPRVESSP